jgi:anti-sigma B factor antagonist
LLRFRGVETQPALRLSTSEENHDAPVVTIGGELEYGTAGPLRSILLELSRREPQVLVLDMADVDFLDSTGISLLIQAKQRFDAQGARFVLRAPPDRVTRVLEVAGVIELFTIES